MSGANRQSQKRRGWNRQTTRVLIFQKPRFLRRANRQSQKRGGWNRQTSISFSKSPDFYERGLIFEKPRFLRRTNRQSQKRGGWNRQTTSTHFRKAQIFTEGQQTEPEKGRVEQTDNEHSFSKSPDFYGGPTDRASKGEGGTDRQRALIFEKPRFLRRANRQSQQRGGWNRQTTSTHFRKAQIFTEGQQTEPAKGRVEQTDNEHSFSKSPDF